MALTKSKYSEIPENAVILSEQQAIQFQSKLIKSWPNKSEVFALRYGYYFLGSAAFLSGLYINNHFRRKFMLGSFGRLATYIPICVLPSVTSLLLHTEMVLQDVILMKKDNCPVCLELRAASIQSMAGVIFPTIVAPLGCASLAQRYATINLPYITEKPAEVFKLFKNMIKPARSTLWYLFLGQAFLGSVVTYFEIKSVIKINTELELEESKANLN